MKESQQSRMVPIAVVACAALTNLSSSCLAVGGLFKVRDYGAAGDGKKVDTATINKAVRACSDAGGGQVRFGPGKYLSGTVHLRDNVTLLFEAGATLVGTKKIGRLSVLYSPGQHARGEIWQVA